MPIPVKCENCQKGLGIPSKYAGKTVKCPACKAPLKVPSAEAESGRPSSRRAAATRPQTAGRPKRRQPVAAAAPSDSDFLADLNLDNFDAAAGAAPEICPKCASPMPEESSICQSCGYDTVTGAKDARFLRKLKNKGPDPSEFYKAAIPDAFEFAKRNFHLVKKTALVWTIFGVFAGLCYWSFGFAQGLPTKFFFVCMTALCIFALAGWFWSLGGEVVKLTMLREKAADRLHVDFFATLAIGIRAVLWPFIMGFPVWLLIGLPLFAFGFLEGPTGIGIAAAIYVAMYLLFPIAQVHRMQRYTYKASILWELVKLVPANFGPLAFTVLVTVMAALPFVGAALLVELYGGGINPITNEYLVDWMWRLTGWVCEMADIGGSPEDPGFLYKMIFGLLMFGMAFPVFALLAVPASFPAVMMMRLNGSFGLFNARKLGIVGKVRPGTPATFWVRVLAFQVDLFAIPFTAFLVNKEKLASIFAYLLLAVTFITWYYSGLPAVTMLSPVLLTYFAWMYYAVSEGSSVRATIGKETYGLIAVPELEENQEDTDLGQLSLRQATGRFFINYLFTLLGGLHMLTCVFADDKRSLGDIISKSRVVFKGDR